MRWQTIVLLIACSADGLAEDPDLAFRSRTVAGRTVTVAKGGETRFTVVCFLGAECPMARLYGPRLSKLADRYRSQNVRFIGVNSNRQDSVQDIRQYMADLNMTFAFVHDEGNRIADQFGATRTPEIFVLDERLRIRYHGRIDDQYEPGINRAEPQREDLRIAIDELLASQDVTVKETNALGCFIGRITPRRETPSEKPVENSITYTKHVAPVLQQHCVECHREGEIGPFAMDNYEEVAGWADTMLETIDNGRMPPWHASPQHGQFANARFMPESDRQVLRDWIAGGLKQGDPDELPPSRSYVDGWQLVREPDQVIEMRNRPFRVPAAGVVEYQYFVADPGFEEDRWISAAQVIPGNRAVVHHAIAFVRPPDGSRFRGLGWISAYVPGQRLQPLPPHHARFVPAGSKLVFQMHYTPVGTEQDDTTRIGLIFADDQEVTHEVYTVIGINQEFEIPPREPNAVVKARVAHLPETVHVLAATPHMHYRGKSFRLYADQNNSEILLDIPRYDFNWQHTYSFTDPLPVRDIEQLHFEATFDNSANNPFNPDPSEWVTWGDQTWEEMAVAFFEVAEPRAHQATKQTTARRRTDRDRKARIDAYVERCLRELDANRDGIIQQNETPIVVRFFSFNRFDGDRDGEVTREELRRAARRAIR